MSQELKNKYNRVATSVRELQSFVNDVCDGKIGDGPKLYRHQLSWKESGVTQGDSFISLDDTPCTSANDVYEALGSGNLISRNHEFFNVGAPSYFQQSYRVWNNSNGYNFIKITTNSNTSGTLSFTVTNKSLSGVTITDTITEL